MKKYLTISFVLVFVLASVVQARAQEGQPQGPSYIVQAGDTLTSIGLRFNISVADLIAANDLANPDQLVAGQELILPGVDWIQGVIEPRSMPFGDTLSSLSRRYRLSPADLARLNRLSSPAQLYVGYPVLFPTGRGEDLTLARAAVAPQMSLLEMAVISNANPWTMAALNQLACTWEALPGDVLLQPGILQTGPAGLPSPITRVDVSPAVPAQGDTAVIRVGAEGAFTLAGELAGYPLNFFPENGGYVALQGVYRMLDPGFYPISISGAFDNGAQFAYSQMIRIADGGYRFETLTVPAELLDPELSEQNKAFVATQTAPVTSEKYWEGYFQTPSPNDDGINSYFGTWRSYNGGVYEGFHSGVDFGGGEGLPIYAPARGVVVFTGFLEVYGNTTIIDHGWGVYTGYLHQREIQVALGDMVVVGQQIGIVGNTGRSSGAHFHWEVWVGGVQVEPLDWLARVYP